MNERDQLKSELAEMTAQRDEFRARLHELQAAVQARWQAEAELANLYRQRPAQRPSATSLSR